MSFYTAEGIHGCDETDLAAERFAAWGVALGQQVVPGEKFVVGGDQRRSTPPLQAGLIEGLCRAGLDVVDLGTLPTPMVYYAQRRLLAAGCAIVTGGNLPAEQNGFRWMIGDLPPTLEDVGRLHKLGDLPLAADLKRARTEPRTLDVTFDYVAWMQETFVESMGGQLHVVVDAMHGCWAARARRYLQAVFPGSIVSTIHDAPDGEFVEGGPDCTAPENLQALSDAVYRQRANLGVAFDGDGQCVAFVDDQGIPLSPEEAVWILLASAEGRLADERFVCDQRYSNSIAEAARRFGATPLIERSGHAAIRTRMARADALFGVDLDGRYFFRALGGCADGFFAVCSLVAYLAQTGAAVSEFRRRCPAVYVTPELHIPLPPAKQEWVIEGIRMCWGDHQHTALDGLRVDYSDGWFLVRSRPEHGLLSFRCESRDWPSLDELVTRICQTAPAVSEELWAAYREAMGTDDGRM